MNLLALDLALRLRIDRPDFRKFFTRLIREAYLKQVHPARIEFLETFAREHGHADLIKK
jgi:hypothetical protein